MLLEYLQWIPRFALQFPSDRGRAPAAGRRAARRVVRRIRRPLWITVYFTTSIRRYVDRAHAAIRQKEKMLGIGQLVAGIAHQIANPLDGVQNCLRRIGERVKDDAHLTEYVQMMTEALERIERTATRVQAFARPRGITLQSTDVRAAVEATLEMLGSTRVGNVRIARELADVPPVQGDPYTLQEVVFNLCTNALAAMPGGGNAHPPLLHHGRPRRRPDGFRGDRRERHGRGHSPRRYGKDLRAFLHHSRRPGRHRPGPGLVPHADCRNGRPHRGPQRPGPGQHVYRVAPSFGAAGKLELTDR